MTIALLPLRSLRDGKRRLQTVASVDERQSLVDGMLQHALAALVGSGAIERILVVSPDPAARQRAERLGASALVQPDQGLNEGLQHGRKIIGERWPGQPLLVMLPDLPFVEPADIASLVALGSEQTVVIAPDRHCQGTNLMWLPAAAALAFAYGVGSFGRHRHAAEGLGFAVRCYHGAGTAFDLDTAEDLELVRRRADSVARRYAL